MFYLLLVILDRILRCGPLKYNSENIALNQNWSDMVLISSLKYRHVRYLSSMLRYMPLGNTLTLYFIYSFFYIAYSIEDINGCRICGNGKCHWQHIVLVAISFYPSSVSKPFLNPHTPSADPWPRCKLDQLVNVIICNAPPSPPPASAPRMPAFAATSTQHCQSCNKH